MPRDIEERLRAVERVLTDDERTPADLSAAAETRDDVETALDRIDDIDERVRELESAVQALRGYVGNIRSVNRDVERRADRALAAAERDDGPATGGSECSVAGGAGRTATDAAVDWPDQTDDTAEGHDPAAARVPESHPVPDLEPADDGGQRSLLDRVGDWL